MTSQIGQFFPRTNDTSQRRLKLVCLIHVPAATSRWHLSMVREVPTYMRPNWDVATTSHAGWVKAEKMKRLDSVPNPNLKNTKLEMQFAGLSSWATLLVKMEQLFAKYVLS